MSRSVARENLVKLVFEYLFLDKIDDIELSNINSNKELSEADLNYLTSSIFSIQEKREEIDGIIKSNLKDFSYSQIFKMDLAILYVAVFEIKFLNIPHQVAINEAVNLAKKYSTDKSHSFINGVLSSVVK